tara:strand:- start:126 stop:320 length:195 start_codon:yes stop_codon:yes gene_type:complete
MSPKPDEEAVKSFLNKAIAQNDYPRKSSWMDQKKPTSFELKIYSKGYRLPSWQRNVNRDEATTN